MMLASISPGETRTDGHRAKLTPMPAPSPNRRTVLLAATALPLAACGIRLERDAPPIPGVPTATAHPDTDVVQDTIGRLRALAAALQQADPHAWTGPLARLHTAQADRLVRLAASIGITSPPASPTPTAPSSTATSSTSISSAPSPTSSRTKAATPSSSSSSTVTVYPAAHLESAEVTLPRLDAIARASDPNRPALMATLASHRAGARLLGADLAAAAAGLEPKSAATVLTPVRTATYAAEVLVAKTDVKKRTALAALLTHLYAERMRLSSDAGSQAPAEQLSYTLPNGADDPARARETMGKLLATCVQAAASCADAATTPTTGRLVQVWGDLVALAWSWGSEPTTFLGLK